MARGEKKEKESPTDLAGALASIEKQFGKGAIMCLGDGAIGPVETIDTGSIALNRALGVGGYPRGRVIEVYGPEGGGKTTLALHAIANAQAAGLVAAFIDAEHALSPEYAAACGVDVSTLLISQPDYGEQGLEIADMLVRSGSVGIVVIDSVAALVPRAEIDGDMGDHHPGAQARLMSQALRKLTASLSASGPTVLFINQLREKIGIMFGNPETTPGGKALKFYASVRLDVRRVETLKEGTNSIGSKLRVKVVKNKVAPPLKVAEFDLLFGRGINHEGEILDLGVDTGVLTKVGSWYIDSGERIGNGREASRKWLDEHPERAVALSVDIAARLEISDLAAAPVRGKVLPTGSREVAAVDFGPAPD